MMMMMMMMGETFYLVQRGGDWQRPQPTQAPNVQPTHKRQLYHLPYCCIMVRCSAVFKCPLKGQFIQ